MRGRSHGADVVVLDHSLIAEQQARWSAVEGVGDSCACFKLRGRRCGQQ